jgi:F5/8 type C domain
MLAVFHRKYSVLIRRLAAVTAPAVLAAPLLVSLPGAAAAAHDPGSAPVVNWALAGQASADSTASGSPAGNATDGDAGTDWCTSAWTGSLTVDLGQLRSLSDLGITLDSTSPSASATIKTAATSGDWQTVPAASNVALVSNSRRVPEFACGCLPGGSGLDQGLRSWTASGVSF